MLLNSIFAKYLVVSNYCNLTVRFWEAINKKPLFSRGFHQGASTVLLLKPEVAIGRFTLLGEVWLLWGV